MTRVYFIMKGKQRKENNVEQNRCGPNYRFTDVTYILICP